MISLEFTWVDALLIAMVAILTAMGAKRRLGGLVVGLGSVLLLRPLVVVGARGALVALVAALLGGVLLALIGRRLALPGLRQRWPTAVLGGVGGFALGAAMLFALVTSLPIERNAANPREIYYPPRDLPWNLSVTLQRSPLVTLGRSILLYPLLPEPEQEAERRALQGLRSWFVEGEPWN